MRQSEYIRHDAIALAELVRSGSVSAIELLETALAQLETVNPTINAVVHSMEADARHDATRLADGPFAGVPFLAKDLGSMYAGHPTTSGSRLLHGVPVTWDSELARRVRATGVMVFGKTNTPEWGLLPVTEPELWGPARNPWDTERTPGGSSGGAGAAIAAGVVPMAGAGDGGGSIRIPASCCGLFGLKPTRGRTPTGPNRGQMWRGATVEHVITRSVRDSAAMLDATHGPDPGVMFEIPPPSGPWLREVDQPPGRLRVAWTTIPAVDTEVDPECVEAVHRTAELLEELGHEVHEDHVPIDGLQFAKDFLTIVTGELGTDVREACVATGRRASLDTLEPTTLALALLSEALSARDFAEALRSLEVMARGVGDFFERYDIVMTPTLSRRPVPIGTIGPTPAERFQLKLLGRIGSGRVIRWAGLIDEAAKSTLDFVPWTPIYNVTGHPAMSVPLHTSEDGLPVGIHLVGRFAREDVLLRLAGQLERARPWFDTMSTMATGGTTSP
ncbi:MAG: amidase family protein [Gemmatimonadota bacterium]